MSEFLRVTRRCTLDSMQPILGSAFIGLGSEPKAQEFRAMLKEAIAKA